MLLYPACEMGGAHAVVALAAGQLEDALHSMSDAEQRFVGSQWKYREQNNEEPIVLFVHPEHVVTPADVVHNAEVVEFAAIAA